MKNRVFVFVLVAIMAFALVSCATVAEIEEPVFVVREAEPEVQKYTSAFTPVDETSGLVLNSFSIENGLIGSYKDVAAYYPFEEIVVRVNAGYKGAKGVLKCDIVALDSGLKVDYPTAQKVASASTDIKYDAAEYTLKMNIGKDWDRSYKLNKSVCWLPGLYSLVFKCDGKVVGYATVELLENADNAM